MLDVTCRLPKQLKHPLCLTIDFKALMSEDGSAALGGQACENVTGCTSGTTTGRGRVAGRSGPKIVLNIGFSNERGK